MNVKDINYRFRNNALTEQDTPAINLDSKYGVYSSLEEACTKIPIEQRNIGMTIGIFRNNIVEEYWWQNGISNEDLYIKKSYDDIDYLQEQINQLHNVIFRIVEELPETGESNVRYLIRNESPEGPNLYDEYVWIDNENRFELYGASGDIYITNSFNFNNTDFNVSTLNNITTVSLKSQDSALQNGLKFYNNGLTDSGEYNSIEFAKVSGYYKNLFIDVKSNSLEISCKSATWTNYATINGEGYKYQSLDYGNNKLTKLKDSLFLLNVPDNASLYIGYDSNGPVGNAYRISSVAIPLATESKQLYLYQNYIDLVPNDYNGVVLNVKKNNVLKDLDIIAQNINFNNTLVRNIKFQGGTTETGYLGYFATYNPAGAEYGQITLVHNYNNDITSLEFVKSKACLNLSDSASLNLRNGASLHIDNTSTLNLYGTTVNCNNNTTFDGVYDIILSNSTSLKLNVGNNTVVDCSLCIVAEETDIPATAQTCVLKYDEDTNLLYACIAQSGGSSNGPAPTEETPPVQPTEETPQ